MTPAGKLATVVVVLPQTRIVRSPEKVFSLPSYDPLKNSDCRMFPFSFVSFCWVVLASSTLAAAFQQQTFSATKRCFFVRKSNTLYARKTITKECSFDPLNLSSKETALLGPLDRDKESFESSFSLDRKSLVAATALVPLTTMTNAAWAASNDVISQGNLNPENFNPVCPASDTLYRFLQSSTNAVVGEENFVEYGPLIAGGLLRVRLELCVVESFFKEAVGPFIQQNGLSWILPLHETVETFLAGVIFALASTFILIGSTKVLSVILIYTDLLIGAPFRLFGGFAYDRALGRPVTLDIGFGPLKTRVIGPPEPKEGETYESEIDLSKANAGSILIVVISGAARLIGQALGVSQFMHVPVWSLTEGY